MIIDSASKLREIDWGSQMAQADMDLVAGSAPAHDDAAAVRSIAQLPAPAGLPLLGNAHQLRPSTLHSVAEGWCAQLGPIFRFKLGQRTIVGIADLDAINTILRDRPGGFRRWRELEDGVGFPGVFVAEGEEWRRQRRLTVMALNSNHLNRYFHVVQTSVERLYRQLRELAHFRRSFDIGRELTSYAVDITSALAFGLDLNTLERRNNGLQKHIQRVMAINGRRLSMPLPYWHWFNLPADRAAHRSLEAIRGAVERFIAEARGRLAERPELRAAPENFLEGMLAAQEADGTFTDEEIIGNTFTLLLAGEDTTAHTIAWTIWMLTSRPDVLSRSAQEADAVLGADQYPVEFESVADLHYTEAVLRESMRLRPVAPLLGVEPLHDMTIADTHMPAGTHLALLTRYAARRQGGFERVDELDPKRWLGGEDGASPVPDQKSFLAFGAGPRFCPGRNLAFLEAKCALAMIARNFEFELDESRGPVHEHLAFTMIPKGLYVRLRDRHGAR